MVEVLHRAGPSPRLQLVVAVDARPCRINSGDRKWTQLPRKLGGTSSVNCVIEINLYLIDTTHKRRLIGAASREATLRVKMDRHASRPPRRTVHHITPAVTDARPTDFHADRHVAPRRRRPAPRRQTPRARLAHAEFGRVVRQRRRLHRWLGHPTVPRGAAVRDNAHLPLDRASARVRRAPILSPTRQHAPARFFSPRARAAGGVTCTGCCPLC